MDKKFDGFNAYPIGWKIAVALGAAGGWALNQAAGTWTDLEFAAVGGALVVFVKIVFELFFGHFFEKSKTK